MAVAVAAVVAGLETVVDSAAVAAGIVVDTVAVAVAEIAAGVADIGIGSGHIVGNHHTGSSHIHHHHQQQHHHHHQLLHNILAVLHIVGTHFRV